MAGDSGNKTENATPKRLRDARKQGDVSKSRDITNTALLVAAALAMWQFAAFAGQRLSRFLEFSLSTDSSNFQEQLILLGSEALLLLVLLSALVLVPVMLVGLIVDFLQIGPILSFDKVKPKLSNLDPVAGVKRMFSLDTLFELVKSIVKTVFIGIIAVLVLMILLPKFLLLPSGSPLHVFEAMHEILLRVLFIVVAIFAFFSICDMGYQKYSFAKKMKMSIKEIKQEHKDSEGDPFMKNQRRQLGKEWASEGATESAKNATVLVVNPTHVAIAIDYDTEETPVPTVSARGIEEIAAAMRSAAEESGVPILRNERLARTLLSDTSEGDVVPRELFDIVAEVILWAQAVTKRVEEQQNPSLENDIEGENTDGAAPQIVAPGEDLTYYPATL